MRPVDNQSDREIESARVVREPFRQGQGKLCLAKVSERSPVFFFKMLSELASPLKVSVVVAVVV